MSGGDVVRQAYDAFARTDIPALLDAMSDDVQLDVPDLLPQGMSARGKEEVGLFFQRLGETYEELPVDVEELIDGDERVAGVGVASGTLHGGDRVEYGFVHVFELTGGKVTRFREYADRSVS
jgi:ketosteroid isomerase-like protein